VNDPDKITWSNGNGIGNLPNRFWGLNEFMPDAEQPAVESATGLVSLGFLIAAVKRRRRLWGTLAVLGLLISCGLYVKHPPGYEAQTSLLLTTEAMICEIPEEKKEAPMPGGGGGGMGGMY